MVKPLLVFAALLLVACSTPTSNKNAEIPKQLIRANPIYPAYAIDNRLTGYVKFDYDVGPDGEVAEMRIIDSKPRYLFDDAVIRAVSKWRFEKNKPYHGLQQVVVFKIANKTKPDNIYLLR